MEEQQLFLFRQQIVIYIALELFVRAFLMQYGVILDYLVLCLLTLVLLTNLSTFSISLYDLAFRCLNPLSYLKFHPHPLTLINLKPVFHLNRIAAKRSVFHCVHIISFAHWALFIYLKIALLYFCQSKSEAKNMAAAWRKRVIWHHSLLIFRWFTTDHSKRPRF